MSVGIISGYSYNNYKNVRVPFMLFFWFFSGLFTDICKTYNLYHLMFGQTCLDNRIMIIFIAFFNQHHHFQFHPCAIVVMSVGIISGYSYNNYKNVRVPFMLFFWFFSGLFTDICKTYNLYHLMFGQTCLDNRTKLP